MNIVGWRVPWLSILLLYSTFSPLRSAASGSVLTSNDEEEAIDLFKY